jgi:hypothetical protein
MRGSSSDSHRRPARQWQIRASSSRRGSAARPSTSRSAIAAARPLTLHGLRQDGVPRREFELTPGVEIGIGASVLVAESARGVAVREFCRRLLGWGGDRMRAVDHALRAVRLAMARRSPLVLCGEGDLIPIARTLHRFAMGDRAPFVVCDRRRRNTSPPCAQLRIIAAVSRRSPRRSAARYVSGARACQPTLTS